MTCYHPVNAIRATVPNVNGKYNMIYQKSTSTNILNNTALQMPCGYCLGCKADKATAWATRCANELKMHKYNSFITLTYDDAHLPLINGLPTLNPRHMTLFLKKLRKEAEHARDKILSDGPIRFIQCGEYGEQNSRPHHHILLLNAVPFDIPRYISGYGQSPTLQRLWSYGLHYVGYASYESAAYIAQYLTKSLMKKYHKTQQKPYLTMSRRPGIGLPWLLKYKDDIYNKNYVQSSLQKARPTKYYDRKLQELDPSTYKTIKEDRNEYLVKHKRLTKSELNQIELAHYQKIINKKREALL